MPPSIYQDKREKIEHAIACRGLPEATLTDADIDAGISTVYGEGRKWMPITSLTRATDNSPRSMPHTDFIVVSNDV